jgi:GntR family transcriptional repressor for pyruvate dehydrogenase complex
MPTPSLSSDELHEQDIVDVVTARRVLEGAIVEHATVTAREDDFVAIDRTVALLAESLESTERSARADAMFHRAVVRAARSRTLERSLAEVDRLLHPIRLAYPPDAREHLRTLDVHRRQLAAMRTRDLDAVRVVVDEHFRLLENMIARRRGVTWAQLFGGRR